MKQFKLYSGMAAVCTMLTFASCGNDIELTEAQAPVKGEYKVTFTASQESSATRTAVDGSNVVWQSGDAITVFDGGGNNRTFELATGAGETTGQFVGTLQTLTPKKYCAVYPLAPDAQLAGGDVVVSDAPIADAPASDYTITGLVLPVEQVATRDGFDPQAAIMTARNDNADRISSTSEDLSLGEFKHVCAFVKVTTTEEYDKITFTAKGGEDIAGGFTVTLDENGISTVTPAADASTTVSLVPASGETTIAAGTYLIAVLPGTLAEGFTMSCSKDDVEHSRIIAMMRSYNGAVGETVFARHNVVNMGTVNSTNWTNRTQEYVDLGLSVKWATCNVGATTSEGYGYYFAWGETNPKENYSWETYKWCNGTYNSQTKYNTKKNYGIIDNKTILDASDDAAHMNWGGAWRMPTRAEIEELININTNNCTWEWTSQNNENGYKVTSLKDGYTDKSIFLPAAGERQGTRTVNTRSYGNYWSVSLLEGEPYLAWYGCFTSNIYRSQSYRYYGFSVRPVLP